MSRTVFGPGRSSARVLTVVLVPFSGFWAYFGFCMGTCGWSEASHEALLFAAVVFALGLLAWKWRPFRVEVIVEPDGLSIHCEGMVLVPRRKFGWHEIAAFGWVPGGPYGSTPFFRVEARPQKGASRGKMYDIPVQGLGVLPPVVLDAAEPHLVAAGYRLDGTLRRPAFKATRVEVVPDDGSVR